MRLAGQRATIFRSGSEASPVRSLRNSVAAGVLRTVATRGEVRQMQTMSYTPGGDFDRNDLPNRLQQWYCCEE